MGFREEARQVLVEEEELQELVIGAAHQDEPGRDDGEEDRDAEAVLEAL